jgi:hypothetical protein
MLTIEKIKHNVPSVVINTIDECVKLQEIDTLKKWLDDCKKEIVRKESLKENTFSLHCEKAYLQMVLNITE